MCRTRNQGSKKYLAESLRCISTGTYPNSNTQAQDILYASLRVFGYASCLVRAFLGVRTLRRSQRGSARTVHMPQMQPSLDFSYLAARDYELLPIMDFSILRAAYLVVVVVTLSDPGIFVFLNGWPG